MTNRGAIFTGTEQPPPQLALDLQALHTYLADRVPGVREPLQAAKFKGGQSNPTYLISSGARRFVLRRRPPGKLLESAHAIDREFRVLEGLKSSGVPVPQPFVYCADESIIGSQFYVAEYVEGRVFWDAELPGVDAAEERSAIYSNMNAVLARLHSLDVAAVGLDDLGRSGEYCARNFARWSKIYEQSKLVDIPEMDWLREQLPRAMPSTETSTLIHGDYGLYNLIVHPTRADVMAVLDWEMATIGDPLVDLAHHLRAWWDLPDANGAATTLRGQDLDALGIPTMQQYIDQYCQQRG
ncbi:MAG: phosphotransferase family protein, partial [Steroidobacteraceae bacterium]